MFEHKKEIIRNQFKSLMMKKLNLMLLFAMFSMAVFAQDAADAPDLGPTTTIEFEEPNHEFGQITQGEKVEHTFTFTNTGDAPLVISNAKGSCGCTVPEWPREVVPVGESGTIKVIFNSRGKKGKRNQKVTITANTNPPQTFIALKGEVLMPEGGDDHNHSHDHDHSHDGHNHNHKH